MELDALFQKEALVFSFDNLIKFLTHNQELVEYEDKLDEIEFPLFVSWMVNGKFNGSLGSFESCGVGELLQEMTIAAAIEDDRFSPITMNEVPSLRCNISLLKNFETIQDPFDW